MFEAVMIASTGLSNQQRRLDTIADNFANINTVGFKTGRLDFKDALVTSGFTPGPAYTPDADQQKGHGVMTAAVTKDFRVGNVYTSGNELDFAIAGEGFFEVFDPTGRVLYTRAGNMSLSAEEDGTFVVNSQGCYVLNPQGDRIEVPEGTTHIDVTGEGTIRFMNGPDVIEEDNFGVYVFANKPGLSYAGSSNFEETVASGEKLPADDPRVQQGALEGSNVRLEIEMTRMIRTSRAFSLASRALTTADEMEGIANNIRR